MHALVLLTLFCLLTPSEADTWGGVVIDARSRAPIIGAEVSLVGYRGFERTDTNGNFRWAGPRPPAPVTIIVILPDGRVARPIRLLTWASQGELTLVAEPAIAETITIAGVAPTIDVAPGASNALLPGGDVNLRAPATLSQVLENVPGVSFISEGQGAVPALRGLARGRSLIVVDGARVSSERRAGSNASFLDPAIVDSLEISRGPGSVAYGSDSFGGIIAVHTRRVSRDSPLHARASATLGGGIPMGRADVELSKGYGSGGMLVGVHAREFRDYRAPMGIVPNSGWRDAGLRLAWEHDTGARIWSVRWQTDRGRQIGRPRNDSATILATSPLEDSHRLTASYHQRSAGWFENVRISGLFGTAKERTDQDRLATDKTPRSLNRADISSREAQVRLTGDHGFAGVRLQVGADVQGRYGLEALDTTEAYNLAGARTSTQTSISIESARRTGFGLFGQADRQIARRIRLSGGLRIDTVRNSNTRGYFGDRHVANTALAGLAGATFAVTKRLTLTTQVARGFRDPTLSDRFYRGPVGRGFIEGNPDLAPETSRQVDLTARWEGGPIRLSGAFYDYRISNLVERYVVDTSSFFFRNRGAARLRGVELEAETSLPHGIALSLSAQVSRGRDADAGTPLDDIAPRSIVAVIRHTMHEKFDSYLRVGAVGRHDAAGPSEVPTPRFVSVDFGAVWHWSADVDVRGIARNLLDQQMYSSAGPRWVYAPGRNVSVSIAVKF